MSVEFKVGDIVWAKMKGYPAWPGKVCEEVKAIKRPVKKSSVKSQFIFFYGTGDYAWMDEDQLFSYSDNKDKYGTNPRIAGLKDAIADAENALKGGSSEPPAVTTIKERKRLNDSFQDDEDIENHLEEPASTPNEPPVINGDNKSRSSLKRPCSDSPSRKSSTPQPAKKPATSSQGIHSILNKPTPPRSSSLFETVSGNRSRSTSKRQDKSHIIATPAKIGFIGLGSIGRPIVTNLLKTGHEVRVWNRSSDKVRDITLHGAMQAKSPAALMQESDILFSCLTDTRAVEEVVFGLGECMNRGIINGIQPRKGYVELTTIDPEASAEIHKAIQQAGGRYLEAQGYGTVEMAEAGSLVLLCAGEKSLYSDCHTCIQAISQDSMFLGEVGNATRLKLALSTLDSIVSVALAECFVLSEKSSGLDPNVIVRALQKGPLSAPGIISQAEAMAKGDHSLVHSSVKSQQKAVAGALQVSDSVPLPMPVAAAANEVLKRARGQERGDNDISSVYWASMNI